MSRHLTDLRGLRCATGVAPKAQRAPLSAHLLLRAVLLRSDCSHCWVGGSKRDFWKIPWKTLLSFHLHPKPLQGLAGTVASFLQEHFVLIFFFISDAYDRAKSMSRILALEFRDQGFTPGKIYYIDWERYSLLIFVLLLNIVINIFDVLNTSCVPGTVLNTLPNVNSLSSHNDLMLEVGGDTIVLIADEETES